MAGQVVPSGTAGANQNGAAGTSGIAAATIDGRGTPGEVLNTGYGAANSAPTGPDIFTEFSRLTVQPAFDLAVAKPLRNRMIWDQFATPKVANLNINGWDQVRLFFGGDIPEDTSVGGGPAPLMENLDVDSVTFSGRSVALTAKEYGRAVSRTRLANVVGQINIDPTIVDRVAFDASRGADALARIALTTAGTTYLEADGTTATPSAATSIAVNGTGDTFLSTTLLQVAISILEQQGAMQFMTGSFILLTNPVGAQHLKNERDTGGFRYVTARNNGSNGNDLYRGTIGLVEGADIVVSEHGPGGQGVPPREGRPRQGVHDQGGLRRPADDRRVAHRRQVEAVPVVGSPPLRRVRHLRHPRDGRPELHQQVASRWCEQHRRVSGRDHSGHRLDFGLRSAARCGPLRLIR